MSPAKHRPTRRQTIVSLVLVAVPVVILLVIFAAQRRADISRFGIASPPDKEQAGQSADALVRLAPRGFKLFASAESYDTETLYQKIDGKAPLYTESGFIRLSTQRYINEKNEDLTFELYLYDMGKAENAFSVYSIQRRADSSPVNEMPFAYRTENALYLARGRYYCELVGSSDSPVILDAVDSVADALFKDLKDAGPTEIPALALFPVDRLIPHTFTLYLINAFGFEGLTDTFTAKYKVNDETVTAFFSKQTDSAAAKKVAAAYYKFLIDNGGMETASTSPDVGCVDYFSSFELVSTVGRFVCGVRQAADVPAAQTALGIVRSKLAKGNQ
jgi:hypothetical protein